MNLFTGSRVKLLQLRINRFHAPLGDILLDRLAKENPIEAVIGVGRAGKDAVEHWPGRGTLPFEAITHPSARDNATLLADWNQGLTVLRSTVDPELGVAPDMTPYGTDWTDADHVPIPPRDLPFGVPEWQGVGSHACCSVGPTHPESV